MTLKYRLIKWKQYVARVMYVNTKYLPYFICYYSSFSFIAWFVLIMFPLKLHENINLHDSGTMVNISDIVNWITNKLLKKKPNN